MSIFYPHLHRKKLTDITLSDIMLLDVKGLILDVDNTLSVHHGKVPGDGVIEWMKTMTDAGIIMIIASNSKKKRISVFSKKVGLDYVSTAFKPLPMGIIKARKRLGLKRNDVAMVGDQIFTDILAAKLAGMKSILLLPLKYEDKLSFKIRRFFEKGIISRYKKTLDDPTQSSLKDN